MREEKVMDEIERGSGNVYADLGFPDADKMLVKAHLVTAIRKAIAAGKLTQLRAAEIVGMPQPRLSDMLRGHFRGISETKMIECLARLGHDVRIVVARSRRRRKQPGRIEVLQEA